ncbi:hypothetical protein QTP88_009975 [Uroleucon formosanum]
MKLFLSKSLEDNTSRAELSNDLPLINSLHPEDSQDQEDHVDFSINVENDLSKQTSTNQDNVSVVSDFINSIPSTSSDNNFFEKRLREGKTIDKELQKDILNEKERWKQILKIILDCVRFCCVNNLALRGSSNDITKSNCGIFLNLIELISSYQPYYCATFIKFQ